MTYILLFILGTLFGIFIGRSTRDIGDRRRPIDPFYDEHEDMNL